MHAASKSFEEKLAAAAQTHYHNSRASVAPVSTRGAVGGVSQHLLPPFDFGPSSRSSSVNSAAGTWHPEDHETVGSLLGSLLPVQHTAMPRPFGGTGSAPTSATTTPRGDAVYHATPLYPPSSFQASSMVGMLPPNNTAATTYDLDVAVADQAQRRFAQDAMRLAQLEAEEAQIAAEERALKMELQEVDARRRTIDAALFAMHREWREFGENQRDLRLEPVLDLSADIAHAEGCVEAVRRRVVDAHHKYDMLQAQLAVVDQVDAHKAAQLATLTELDQRFKELNARRSAAVSWIKAQAWIDNTRAQLTNQAKMQLEAVEHLAALDRAQMPQFQQQPPTLPTRTPLAPTNGVVPALKGSRAVVQQQQAPIASSRAASQRSVSRAVDDASRPANADAASQARRGASCSSARSGVSFAIQLDDESDDVASHDEDDDVQQAPPAFHPDDISGGMSFAFPTVANVLGMKRNRSEVHAS